MHTEASIEVDNHFQVEHSVTFQSSDVTRRLITPIRWEASPLDALSRNGRQVDYDLQFAPERTRQVFEKAVSFCEKNKSKNGG